MNKNYFFLSALVGFSFLLSFEWNSDATLEQYYAQSHLRNSNGSPAGRTGAPGEANCTACHSGTVQSDAGVNSITISDIGGPVTGYIPGQVYTITVAMNSGSPKNGFEITAFNSSNAAAGTVTITDATHTKVLTGASSKKYVTHTAAGNQIATWSYNWTAPATNVGNITFYLATNETNNNGGSGGDIIRLSQKVIGSTVGIEENEVLSEVSIGYASASNSLNVIVDSKEAGDATINIIDLSGKSVQYEALGTVATGKNGYSVKLDNALPKGIYVAHIGVNNNFTTKKFYVE